jgi:hypothetical protein
MSAENILKIKIKLKEDYNFIKNDGNILTNIVKDLLTENDNDLQKTFDFIDTLTKKDIQTRMQKIINELETAGEISNLIKETIKKYKTESDNLKLEIDGVINKIFELEETVSELENDKEKLEQSFETKHIELVTLFDTQTNKLKTEVDVLITTKDSLHAELTEIKDSINGVFRKGIYNDEFEYEECDYIIKEPVIHLKTKITIKDISLNFPILEKLQDYEYIIKYYYLNTDSFKKQSNLYFSSFSSRYNCDKHVFILYITNYGRLIKSDIAHFNIQQIDLGYSCMGGHRGYYHDLCLNPIMNVYGYELVSYSKTISCGSDKYNILGKSQINYKTIKPYKLINAPKLTFRMPRIFLDVIDAFHTQNNDLMQDCCKKYLDITRESQYKTDLILSIEQNSIIQKQSEELDKKDKEIEERDIIIKNLQEELEKLKLENAKLKTALSVLTS